jgi:hypothetical protein
MGYQIPPPQPNETYESFIKRLNNHDEYVKEKSLWFKLFSKKKKK